MQPPVDQFGLKMPIDESGVCRPVLHLGPGIQVAVDGDVGIQFGRHLLQAASWAECDAQLIVQLHRDTDLSRAEIASSLMEIRTAEVTIDTPFPWLAAALGGVDAETLDPFVHIYARAEPLASLKPWMARDWATGIFYGIDRATKLTRYFHELVERRGVPEPAVRSMIDKMNRQTMLDLQSRFQ